MKNMNKIVLIKTHRATHTQLRLKRDSSTLFLSCEVASESGSKKTHFGCRMSDVFQNENKDVSCVKSVVEV